MWLERKDVWYLRTKNAVSCALYRWRKNTASAVYVFDERSIASLQIEGKIQY